MVPEWAWHCANKICSKKFLEHATSFNKHSINVTRRRLFNFEKTFPERS